MTNMGAELLLQERRVLTEDSFVELVAWQIPTPVPGSVHRFKYRLALVVKGKCRLLEGCQSLETVICGP